ncbi:hypothetical protein [Aurantibacillus circumpalustris]|uniref:hypothetical protein n=1 Tax=Aurantibacillus circumpalustris TaxID=3036359 RepID=UPI00295B73D8|nr:hypothetical protein [Aurantibacillus circumpalustris]
MKKIVCKSGAKGWQSRLRKNYDSLEEFEYYSQIYGIHKRLGFESAQEAWDTNPILRGSVIPSDLEVVR